MSFPLLELLSDGAFHSGQQLADKLGVSRTAIWKQIESLAAQGVVIDTVRGKGYRWLGASPLLSALTINGSLRELSDQPIQCDVLTSVDSTNQYLLARASSMPTASSVVAELQLGGRGRRGRVWHSPLAQNLYVSTLFKVSNGASALQGLSLLVGISLATTIKVLYGMDIGLKWPNDLLFKGKKLGGILVELQGDISGECAAVIGFGLNVNMQAQPCADEIDQAWSSISQEVGKPVCRNELLAQCLAALHKDLARLQEDTFAVFIPQWQQLDVYTGKTVNVEQGAVVVSGIYKGIDVDGALIIDVAGNLQRFHGGEVSLRCV